MSEGPSGNPDELRAALEELEIVTTRLRMTSRQIALGTVLSLVTIVGFGLALPTAGVIFSRSLLSIGLLIPAGVILLIVKFDQVKRQGDTLFKEISDELQWYSRYESTGDLLSLSVDRNFEPESYSATLLKPRVYLLLPARTGHSCTLWRIFCS